MKAERRHQLASNALARELEGVPGQLKRHANTILTVILALLAGFMLVRWRLASAEAARQTVLNQLAVARSAVDALADPRLAMQPPKYIAANRQNQTLRATDAISSILTGNGDAKVKAQAMVARGDLYWHLANMPELPGSATDPALKSSEPPEELLTKAADAYESVLKNETYLKQEDAVVSAHFGLAAIAENRRDWDLARQHLSRIADDTEAPPALVNEANRQLALIPKLAIPLYVAEGPDTATAKNPVFPLISSVNAATSKPATTQSVVSSPLQVVGQALAATQPATTRSSQ